MFIINWPNQSKTAYLLFGDSHFCSFYWNIKLFIYHFWDYIHIIFHSLWNLGSITAVLLQRCHLISRRYGGRLNIQIPSNQYRDPNIKDTLMVSPPSYFWHGNPHTRKKVWYWTGAVVILTSNLAALLKHMVRCLFPRKRMPFIKWRAFDWQRMDCWPYLMVNDHITTPVEWFLLDVPVSSYRSNNIHLVTIQTHLNL